MKRCNIYKTDKNYIIVTTSLSDIGLKIADDPIYVLPISCKLEEIKEKIFDSLDSSREEIYTPKKDEWDIWQKKILEKMQQKTFSILYKNSNSCNIIIDDNTLKIQPLKLKDPKKPSAALYQVTEDELVLEYNKMKKDEIIIKIIEVLDKSYR